MQRAARYRLFPFVGAFLLAAVGAACADKAVAPDGVLTTPPMGALNVGIVVQEDGTVLSGRLFGDEHDVLVILSHMLSNDQTAWFPFARALAQNGYAALTFDSRGYGISPGNEDFAKLDEDLSAAVRYMRARGKQQIFLIGASMGGTTSLVVAAQEDVSGVVAVSAPAEFQDQDALGAIGGVTAPMLLIVGEGDTAAMVSLEELLGAAGPVESQTYTDDAHGTNLFEGEEAAAVQERILQFLQEHAGN